MNDVIGVLLLVGMALVLVGIGMLWRRIDASSNDVRHLDIRVTRLEERMDSLPTHRELTEIRLGIAALGADVSAMRERSQVTAEMVGTIQKHLLQEDD